MNPKVDFGLVLAAAAIMLLLIFLVLWETSR